MKIAKQTIFYSFIVTFLAAGDILCAQDHPLIKPYAGSVRIVRKVFDFDEAAIPLGPLGKDNKLTKSQRLEGKITRLNYNNPAGRSTLEVYRNYETALKQGGFEMLFSAGPDGYGGSAGGHVELPKWGFWPDYRSRYLAARLSRSEGDVWVALQVGLQTTDILIVEVKPMDTGMVTVNAAALANDITNTGHVAIYGIFFDTGKAEVKPASEPTLAEIAKLLQGDPKLKLYVVGHTDSVGDLTMNMDLSRRRANAVAQALAGRHGIAPARLRADGVGPLAPVASNDNEDGRAKNRRVELVKQ